MSTHQFLRQFTTNFEYIKAKSTEINKFTVLYTHGLYSDPWGRKPDAVRDWCAKNNIDFFRYELAGHGSDAGNYENVDVNLWKAQILEIIDTMIEGDIVVVGSSLGGWLSLIAAEVRPDRVKAVLGLAAAPDFTVDLEDKYLTPEQNKTIQEQGRLEFTNDDFTYVFTKKLMNTGRENQMLNRQIEINCPVHLIQGQKDASLDWRKALQISQAIQGNNVTIKLLKYSNHRLGEDSDLEAIASSLSTIKEQIR
ncbi:MAG: alpha/beta hydrolase [Alphaproteobacteria bacterium]|nr:alpha/beta hydrolase [Alphaproteobacteria bacterium]